MSFPEAGREEWRFTKPMQPKYQGENSNKQNEQTTTTTTKNIYIESERQQRRRESCSEAH